MRIFVSYPSERRPQAESIAFALRDAGHTVFLDKDDLPPGKTYDDQIRNAIKKSELVVFLMAPEAFEANRYTLSELAMTRAKWPSPKNHVLPVIIADTPMSAIPPYLSAITFLKPAGNLVADVAHEIERLRRRRFVLGAVRNTALVIAGLAAVGGVAYYATRAGAPAQARFALAGFDEQVVHEIGATEDFQIVNETPDAASGFTCRLEAGPSANVAEARADAACTEASITLIDRPFMGPDGQALAPPSQAPQTIEIPVRLSFFDRRGRPIADLQRTLRAANTLATGLRVEGRPPRLGLSESAEIRLAYRDGALPAAFSCAPKEVRQLTVTETGRCAYRVAPVRAAVDATWLAEGNTQPVFLAIEVRDGSGRLFAEHLTQIEVAN
ncbi:MAG: TIR domain-containing protein [Alphaproteobacteria bacterium]|nr:TIR domain-containing protein [Alphaproteobacteria bacterium]